MLEKIFESLLNSKVIKPVNLKEINPDYSLEGLKLKLRYFGHLMRRTDKLEKTHAGKDGGQEKKGVTQDEMVGWHHRLNGYQLSKLWQILKDRETLGDIVHGFAESWT